ncbi:Glycoside hydrolase family 43 protein [Mycena sanguinolenta]|uniref:Glycoside hydrolase family 43 protein n=1 Tax=Mycena sanguinolenta TaxID=230812 RepID=A0A8H6YS96_9AGAR|nr:Glycoside hydrolase family 43 protein [Mycena sanguinolenta]
MYSLLIAVLSGAGLAVGRPHNPILPGFHPDPSCIFVPEWDDTFFCASSSFNAFPGIPIHASQDLQNWKLIGNALSRPEQLPTLTDAVGGTSGIWAPSLRYHDGEFFILTTLVFDKMDINDTARWDNIILRTTNPFATDAWSDPVHFSFDGYDTSPFWDEDGTVYVQGSHPWEVSPHIDQIQLNLETGGATEQVPIWNGTGGLAPEGPHMHLKDGYYYLIIAEGGTGLNHMETAARSKQITGPFTPAPHNPLLTNANTSAYCRSSHSCETAVTDVPQFRLWAMQTFSKTVVGTGGQSHSRRARDQSTFHIQWHAGFPSLFFTRLIRFQGRETVLTNVTWAEGEWPVFENVSGIIGDPILPSRLSIPGDGPWITAPDSINFTPGSELPLHFAHWRLPDPAAYVISPPGHENTLRLLPSLLNLTGFDENSAPTGQTFVGRRQVHSEFVYSVDMEYTPQVPEEEAGVSVFLTQNHHIDFGIVCLANTSLLSCADSTVLRIRTTSSTAVGARPDTIVPLAHPQTTRLEIRADNLTHYTFSYSQTGGTTGMITAGYGLSADVSWGFTGTILGVYATGNGQNASTPAYVSRWRYDGVRQIISNEDSE